MRHRQRQITGFARVHTTPEDSHRPGRHLVIRNTILRIALNQPVNFGGTESMSVPFLTDKLNNLHTFFPANSHVFYMARFIQRARYIAFLLVCQASWNSFRCHSERSEESPVGGRFFAALRMTARAASSSLTGYYEPFSTMRIESASKPLPVSIW